MLMNYRVSQSRILLPQVREGDLLELFISHYSLLMCGILEPPSRSGHYDPDAVRSCAQTVALHWQTLMLRIEDRLKLVNASAAFYRTSQQVPLPFRPTGLPFCLSLDLPVCLSLQVCGVLESLEQEYRREEDWCGGGDRQPEQLMPLINKHMEQKEAFLKVRTLGEALITLLYRIRTEIFCVAL